MAIDFETAMAAQRVKSEIIAWFAELIRRDLQVREANEAAAKHALERESNPDKKAKKKSKHAHPAWQAPWPRGR